MIRVNNLSKFFAGNRALGPVSFAIAEGETVGFLGLNGAGKTTALRILACDLRPTSGTVTVGAVDAIANPHAVRKQIGFLPETPPLYPDMRVADFLHFAGRLRGMSTTQVNQRLPDVLEVTNLADHTGVVIGNLSHGFRQRVGVAQAIIHEPALLILDEPTRGLDPVQIVEMRSLIQELKKAHTVLISSHILTEISQTCDRLLVLGKGAIIAAGDENELSTHLSETRRLAQAQTGASCRFQISVKATEEDDLAASASARIRSVENVTDVVVKQATAGELAFRVSSTGDTRSEVCRALVQAGHNVVALTLAGRANTGSDHATNELEEIFLGLVEGGSNAGD